MWFRWWFRGVIFFIFDVGDGGRREGVCESYLFIGDRREIGSFYFVSGVLKEGIWDGIRCEIIFL